MNSLRAGPRHVLIFVEASFSLATVRRSPGAKIRHCAVVVERLLGPLTTQGAPSTPYIEPLSYHRHKQLYCRRSVHHGAKLRYATVVAHTWKLFSGARHESGIQAELSTTAGPARAAKPLPGGLRRAVQNPRRRPHFRAVPANPSTAGAGRESSTRENVSAEPSSCPRTWKPF